MHQHHDANAHRDPDLTEAPLDAASQSLADALRSSFGILKVIMVILVVVYLFSNVSSIASHEQALILRMGSLNPTVREAGLVWAFPFPIEEIVRLPTRKSNNLTITSHTFARKESEKGRALSMMSRGAHSGLNPAIDGALLTADAGLVHVQWEVTYNIHDVRTYVTQMAGKEVEAAEALIRVLVETIGVQVASELTAEQIIRTRVDYVQGEMKRRINERLGQLNSGVTVVTVEMFEPIVPLQVQGAFETTQQAENAKEKRIRQAQQERTKILSEAAGAIYQELVEVLDELDEEDSEASRAKLDRLLQSAEGKAGQMLKDVGAYLSVVVGQMQSDVREYQTLVPEYERSAAVLIERLWEQTRLKIFQKPGVVKLYRPSGLQEFRVTISIDPEQTRAEEARRLREKDFDVTEIRPRQVHAIGPEAG
ncbi:MAG: hypothetical protein IIB60_01190 [Planctomycetes bacterium]|nr:hypothetical protein [Planctomycetota bacterium]